MKHKNIKKEALSVPSVCVKYVNIFWFAHFFKFQKFYQDPSLIEENENEPGTEIQSYMHTFWYKLINFIYSSLNLCSITSDTKIVQIFDRACELWVNIIFVFEIYKIFWKKGYSGPREFRFDRSES